MGRLDTVCVQRVLQRSSGQDGGAKCPRELRLEGAIFFRSELTKPFAFESTPAAPTPDIPEHSG